MARVALDHLLLGRAGEIGPGQEIPATYLDSLGDEQKTDFDRLEELGLVEPAKRAAKPKSAAK